MIRRRGRMYRFIAIVTGVDMTSKRLHDLLQVVQGNSQYCNSTKLNHNTITPRSMHTTVHSSLEYNVPVTSTHININTVFVSCTACVPMTEELFH